MALKLIFIYIYIYIYTHVCVTNLYICKCITNINVLQNQKKDSALTLDTEEIDSRITIQSFWAISGNHHGQIVQ